MTQCSARRFKLSLSLWPFESYIVIPFFHRIWQGPVSAGRSFLHEPFWFGWSISACGQGSDPAHSDADALCAWGSAPCCCCGCRRRHCQNYCPGERLLLLYHLLLVRRVCVCECVWDQLLPFGTRMVPWFKIRQCEYLFCLMGLARLEEIHGAVCEGLL